MSAMAATSSEGDVEVLAWLPPTQRDRDFPSAARQAAIADALARQGIRGALWLYESASEGTVAALHARIGLAVNPVVPNMRDYLRDASEHGVVGAALHRFRRLRPADQLRIALHQARHAPRVLARDFASGVLVMVEMELARFRGLSPRYAVLNASVTDLALALEHARLLHDFIGLAAGTYGLRAALGTYNYGILCERLTAWGIRPDAIVAPFNPRGYLMNPSKEDCERTLKGSDIEVLASHIEVDGVVERREALAYLSGLSIRRGVVELAP